MLYFLQIWELCDYCDVKCVQKHAKNLNERLSAVDFLHQNFVEKYNISININIRGQFKDEYENNHNLKKYLFES